MKRIVLTAPAVMLCACSAMPPADAVSGKSFEQIRSALGTPVYEIKLANGDTRRFYRDAASLVRTWRAEFDARDRLLQIVPATTSAEFAEVAPGKWSKADILERFGPPYKAETASGSGETSLFYLFRQHGIRDAYMVLTCDASGVLVRTEAQRINLPASVHSRPDVP